ncbi:MAG: hypothetical protein KA113_11925 [Syntrophaceae bacterium]|nr:hypothetical protein [Syntrophaceae bacterium]
MQGRLRNESLTATVHTSCAHCGMPMTMTIGSDLSFRAEGGCEPVIFIPHVDLTGLADESIISAF